MNEISINNKMLPVVCGCDLSAAAEPFFHADRKLPYHVLIYVLDGAIYVTEEDTDYEIQAGELLFLKSGFRHFGKKEIPRGTRWYYCHFFYEEREFPAFEPDDGLFVQGEVFLFSSVLPKKIKGVKGSRIESSLADLTAFVHSGGRRKKWEINERFFRVLEEIAFFEQEKSSAELLSDKICYFLNEHLASPFSGVLLEENFYLSYKHLAAIFKKEKQMTLWQYHQRARMEEACRLLKSTVLPVGEIAKKLGYQDMLYFSRCFHQFAGMCPTAYRKNAASLY